MNKERFKIINNRRNNKRLDYTDAVIVEKGEYRQACSSQTIFTSSN